MAPLATKPILWYPAIMLARSLATACFAAWLFSLTAFAGSVCNWSTHKSAPPLSNSLQFEHEHITASDYTSFRGLRLSMSRIEAKKAIAGLGFDLIHVHSNALDICSRRSTIGTVRFNQHGRVVKLELSPSYFGVPKLNVREFADTVFEHYKVRPEVTADDVCFHDVTCFRGTTLTEKLLILRIGSDVQFHIMPRRSGSPDLTQNK
jgi:hypothetical protein